MTPCPGAGSADFSALSWSRTCFSTRERSRPEMRAAHGVGERRDLDDRAAEGGREQRGEGRHVGGDLLDVPGDRVDPDELGVGGAHRGRDLVEQRDGLVGDALDHAAGLVEHAAELDERHCEHAHQQHERHGSDQPRDLSSRHAGDPIATPSPRSPAFTPPFVAADCPPRACAKCWGQDNSESRMPVRNSRRSPSQPRAYAKCWGQDNSESRMPVLTGQAEPLLHGTGDDVLVHRLTGCSRLHCLRLHRVVS